MNKTLAVELQDLREEIAKEIELKVGCDDAAAIARGSK